MERIDKQRGPKQLTTLEEAMAADAQARALAEELIAAKAAA